MHLAHGNHREARRHDGRAAERRAHRRLIAVGGVTGTHEASGTRFRVMNFGRGGLRVHAHERVVLDQVLWVRFDVGNASASIMLPLRVVHMMEVASPDDPSYVIGLEFLPSVVEEQREAILALLTQSGGPGG